MIYSTCNAAGTHSEAAVDECLSMSGMTALEIWENLVNEDMLKWVVDQTCL